MKFQLPLVEGRLIKRYKRFLADVKLEDGRIVTAHCANSGSMMGLKDEGLHVWLSPKPQGSKGVLDYRWELIELEGNHTVGINTSHPNEVVAEAIQGGKIPELSGYKTLRREVKYGKNSRIDILLESESRPPCYVEVKNVHLKRADFVEFPDSVTARGAKHLIELAEMVRQGARAVMVYLVQRTDSDSMRIAKDIDPLYWETFMDAHEKGVEMLAYGCHLDRQEIFVNRKIQMLYQF